ncbi:uncharacterized protein EKO05_0005808 [Ascochyta rabiei]|uniref:Uncharacterized protein n=1 Tax=Didymella rabiei TaxID=5454 RepID=A0A163LLH8_DIDRA|nr:uncharacterized protein EKO05_0005808 [Ascochyta rabiei]KZM27898.1 hypothetical protein ST47_g958 [Ascochyta rabiei]UPX15361.1 hypothetical protein EKO05_0005808 [Ascochyta rabiei]
MGRSHASKFSFPLPGRRSQPKETPPSPSPFPAAAQPWPSHLEEPTSKAHRVLGTSESPSTYRSSSRHAPTMPASPAYTNPTLSSESGYRDNHSYDYDYDYDYDHDDSTWATVTDHASRPAMSKRPSSNILGNASRGTTRRGSDNSSASYRLQPQSSNSTMRSHYDAKASPLSISQQTSNSAVRDMALRRGKPQVVTDSRGYAYSGHEASPVSPMMHVGKREHRKTKPARLDLSKLFPKPKGGDGHSHSNQLLSPAKMVNSPAAMSMNSEYFAQPMSREPTPAPKARAKITQHATRRHAEHASMPASPKRLFKRDDYDNAKVNVRRPPKGVQHWFDALDEDSDEALEEARAPIYAPQARQPSNRTMPFMHRTSFSGIYPETATSRPAPRAQKSVPGFNGDSFSHEDMIDVHGLTSPSQFSLHTQNSTKTKESTWSKRNLQDSSCLSFSSSEDEFDDDRHAIRTFAVRESLNMDDDAGEIVFGQAQAFEVRSNRMPFERKMSIMSTSTNAATIDIMYTPGLVYPPNLSRLSSYSGSRRSSHLRQPSVILEDEDDRPRTAAHAPPSSSAYSTYSMRTSASEPQPRSLTTDCKMMSVTPEEEALLELMRKKRASMAKQSSASMSKAYIEQEDERRKAIESLQKTGQTSTFATETLVASPVRVVEMKSKRKSLAASSTSSLHLTPPPRGRPTKTTHDAHMFSSLRDSSVSDNESFSFPIARGSLPHHIPAPDALSPLDPFPPISPSHTACLTSPTTIDHVSPLPSPITPGLRVGESHDVVKIASSDTSADSEDIATLETDLPVHIIKAAKSVEALESNHQRRRTASSDADMSFPVPPSFGAKDLVPVSEAGISSRAPSIVEPTTLPGLPERSSTRQNALKRALEQRSRQSSVVSNASSRSNASSMNVSSLLTGRERSRRASRGSSVASMTRSKGRNSASDDVLAAWGSLGGTY